MTSATSAVLSFKPVRRTRRERERLSMRRLCCYSRSFSTTRRGSVSWFGNGFTAATLPLPWADCSPILFCSSFTRRSRCTGWERHQPRHCSFAGPSDRCAGCTIFEALLTSHGGRRALWWQGSTGPASRRWSSTSAALGGPRCSMPSARSWLLARPRRATGLPRCSLGARRCAPSAGSPWPSRPRRPAPRSRSGALWSPC
mmetsp:Transcript_5191/g.15270  ORF Transcript_5191/g.15270 Transcript_5191/m.15270 type:complete len:200 (+) Transcript_5191:162-761(+)